jgi:hypothetical protein
MIPKPRENIELIRRAKGDHLTNAQIKQMLAKTYNDEEIDKIFEDYYRSKIISFAIISVLLVTGGLGLSIGGPAVVGNLVLGVPTYGANSLPLFGIIFSVGVVLFGLGIFTVYLYKKNK